MVVTWARAAVTESCTTAAQVPRSMMVTGRVVAPSPSKGSGASSGRRTSSVMVTDSLIRRSPKRMKLRSSRTARPPSPTSPRYTSISAVAYGESTTS